MTFFEWIRKFLLWDAKKHRMPDEQKMRLKQRITAIKPAGACRKGKTKG